MQGSSTTESRAAHGTAGPGVSRSASRSPCSSTRSSTSRGVELPGRLVAQSPSPRPRPRSAAWKRSAVGWARSEYGATVVFAAAVLAPVDEDLAGPHRPGHLGGDRPRAPCADSSSATRLAYAETVSASCVPEIGQHSCMPFLPDVFGYAATPSSASRSRISTATPQHSLQPGRRARVEVHHHQVGVRADPPLRGVQLQRGQVGHPDQRGQLVDHDEVDGLPGTSSSRAPAASPGVPRTACRRARSSRRSARRRRRSG